MFIVISYDIPDDRRRTRVMKALKDYGRHVQYSVFECELKPEEFKRLRERLQPLISRKEDNLRFYHLCQEDVKKRRIWGSERSEAVTRAWYIVGKSAPRTEPEEEENSPSTPVDDRL